MVMMDGTIYEGFFDNDKFNGKGKITIRASLTEAVPRKDFDLK
jgi:hypothetical protein